MQMGSQASQFVSRVAKTEADAAKEATSESRVIYSRWASGRPLAPARKGRATTSGQFADLLTWSRTGAGVIEFDLAGLQALTPTSSGAYSYALIQEIGTGQTASIIGDKSFSVPFQTGRRISPNLFWSSSESGGASRPMTMRNRQALQRSGGMGMEQLFLRPAGQFARAGRIRREIKGKHFIRDGGMAGYEMLRQRLAEDFKSSFRNSGAQLTIK